MKMMNNRVWMGMAVGTVIISVLVFCLATPGADTGNATPEPESAKPAQSSALPSQNYEGMLTDTHCGAKHSAAVGMSAADCTRACVHSGEHFALVDGEKAYILEGDEAALKRMAGQRVKIVGTLTGGTISVSSVATPAP
ncbi:MAG: hypothetical protein WAM04_16160 [Candidatus Sulfotelmatobacter sp.]